MNDAALEPIDWERQRAFLAVMTEGSLSAAARALQIAQPTVRRRVEELERQLGAALFTRSPQGLTPTDIARRLGDPAKAMALAADAFTRAASGEAGVAGGTVRITASEVVSVEVLPPLIAKLRALHPGIVIELGVNNSSEDLLRGEADIAVRMAEPAQKSLIVRRIGAVRLGLHAHRRYVDVFGQPATLDDLKNFAVIGFEHETIGVRALRAKGLRLDPASFAFRSDSDLAQLAAIRAGVGIGVCQSALAARDRNLVPILTETFGFDLETSVVMHEDLRGVRRVRLVYDALVAHLKAYLRGAA